MINNFTLRPATNVDCPEVQALIFAVLREYGLAPDPDQTDRDLADLQGHYFDHGGYFGVVEEAGVIIATVGLSKVDATTCELRKMYALPLARGKGLGRYLLDFAIDKAKSWGCERMTLETASVLVEAIGLYRRYGFREYYPPHITCRCDMAMELDLVHAKT